MASTIKAGNATTGLAMSSDGTGTLNILTGTGSGTTAMTIDASQNVGIGISSTNGYWGSTNTDAKVNIAYSSSGTTFDTSTKGLVLQNTNTTTSNTTSLIFGSQNTGGTGIAQAAIYSINGTRGGAFNSGQLGFSYANSSGVLTEAMRIDASGNLFVNTTSQIGSASKMAILCPSGFSGLNIQIGLNGQNGVVFYNTSVGVVGAIAINASTTTYGTTSDYRLKENVQPMIGALDKVALLKPVTYNWKADGLDGQGFIAHELQAVVPDAVIGGKDDVDDEGNPKYQSIDTSFLVATLTAAIQEQQVMIQELSAKVAALEAR
jgi:hypothetical protein